MALKEIMLSVDTRTREVDAGKQAKWFCRTNTARQSQGRIVLLPLCASLGPSSLFRSWWALGYFHMWARGLNGYAKDHSMALTLGICTIPVVKGSGGHSATALLVLMTHMANTNCKDMGSIWVLFLPDETTPIPKHNKTLTIVRCKERARRMMCCVAMRVEHILIHHSKWRHSPFTIIYLSHFKGSLQTL
jgi:hypothetical protein